MKPDEIKEQMEDMLTAERASEFLEKYDSCGSIKKSGKTKSRRENGDLSSASIANISRKVNHNVGATKKKMKVSASPSPVENQGARKSTQTPNQQFHQSASVNALDTALKKQLAGKLNISRAHNNHSVNGLQAKIELKKE